MKFLATAELGRLCKWLRILGYDCEYCATPLEKNFGFLKIRSLQEDRVILTRNARLGKRSGYKVVHVKDDLVADQLKQVIRELKLEVGEDIMFTRCTLCNLPLERIDKKDAERKVPKFVYETSDDFVKCAKCGRIYWHGSHWGNAKEYIDGIRG